MRLALVAVLLVSCVDAPDLTLPVRHTCSVRLACEQDPSEFVDEVSVCATSNDDLDEAMTDLYDGCQDLADSACPGARYWRCVTHCEQAEDTCIPPGYGAGRV